MQPWNKYVVYKLDRLARSTIQLYEITEKRENEKVEFISLRDNIDTTISTSKAMFGMLVVFEDFVSNLIAERTEAGLQAARKSGRVIGRLKIDMITKRKIVTLYNGGERAKDIAEEYSIGRSTVYKIING